MTKILFGVPPKHHVQLSNDEFDGLTALGIVAEKTNYGNNDPNSSKFRKLKKTVSNAFLIVKRLRQTRYDFLYLSSRIEPIGCVRDFITLLIVKVFFREKIKIVVKSHGSDCSVLTNPSFLYRKMVVPFLAARVDGWFILSRDEIATISLCNPVIGSKLFLVPNIVNTGDFNSREAILDDFNIPVDKFRVLFAGRLVREKGCFDIINSIPLFENAEKAVFLFAGDGIEEKNLRNLSTNLQVDDKVMFLGFLSEPILDNLYSKVDVLVFPSYDEGFSMVLFKSIAAGLPVITTKIRAAKDYLKEPENVLWVDTQAPEMLAEKLNCIFVDRTLQNSMRMNNLVLGEEFSKDKVCKLLFKHFKNINDKESHQ